jgi:general secretion pathway protein I
VKRGFTLLEMLVATVIMAIAIVGLMSALSGAMRNASRLTSYDRAVQLARLQMNELMLNPGLPRDTVIGGEFSRDQSGGIPAGWRARITPFATPRAPAPGRLALDRIELQVWWMFGGQQRTFGLEGFHPRTLRREDLPPAPTQQ